MSRLCKPIATFVSTNATASLLQHSAPVSVYLRVVLTALQIENGSVDLGQRLIRAVPVRPSDPEHARDGAGRPAGHNDPELAGADVLASESLLEGGDGAR